MGLCARERNAPTKRATAGVGGEPTFANPAASGEVAPIAAIPIEPT